ncbi:hypothetical protein BAU08_12800 [Bordetella bronchialis]|uniref:Uncharacterized protein n=2 Tax=Bordetella bronchialis TaxID=463025 RepID=A0A193FYM8_9BORD|nr:hypothetical protein BAU08_12800 [Bordetella bronchialis]
MPFEDGESIMRLLQRGTKISTYEACTMGVKLLRTGMTLPQPYLDTFTIYSVTHRATPDPAPAAPPERRIESPGPHLGI